MVDPLHLARGTPCDLATFLATGDHTRAHAGLVFLSPSSSGCGSSLSLPAASHTEYVVTPTVELGLDWSLNASNPVWQAYGESLQQEKGDVEWTYQFYLEHLEDIPEYDTSVQHWGCFAHEYHAEEQAIRLHFAGTLDRSGYGPLTSLRKEARIAELRSLFHYIKDQHPEAQSVHGGSWLYNRKEYTRLFPTEFGLSAQADRPHLIARGLWGQFLRHNGRMNEQMTALFRERLSQLHDVASYPHCFPYQAMLTKAPIELFYQFYGRKESIRREARLASRVSEEFPQLFDPGVMTPNFTASPPDFVGNKH